MRNPRDIARSILNDSVHRGSVILSKEDAESLARAVLSPGIKRDEDDCIDFDSLRDIRLYYADGASVLIPDNLINRSDGSITVTDDLEGVVVGMSVTYGIDSTGKQIDYQIDDSEGWTLQKQITPVYLDRKNAIAL